MPKFFFSLFVYGSKWKKLFQTSEKFSVTYFFGCINFRSKQVVVSLKTTEKQNRCMLLLKTVKNHEFQRELPPNRFLLNSTIKKEIFCFQQVFA